MIILMTCLGRKIFKTIFHSLFNLFNILIRGRGVLRNPVILLKRDSNTEQLFYKHLQWLLLFFDKIVNWFSEKGSVINILQDPLTWMLLKKLATVKLTLTRYVFWFVIWDIFPNYRQKNFLLNPLTFEVPII